MGQFKLAYFRKRFVIYFIKKFRSKVKFKAKIIFHKIILASNFTFDWKFLMKQITKGFLKIC